MKTNHPHYANTVTTFLLTLSAVLFASPLSVHAGGDLVVYPDVPGLAASAHYKVRLRSGIGEDWKNAFVCETVCKTVAKDTEAYFDSLAGWTHAYVNYETSGVSEIEIG